MHMFAAVAALVGVLAPCATATKLQVDIYTFGDAALTSLPDFSGAVPATTVETEEVDFTPSKWASLGYTTNFAARVTGTLTVPVSGLYAINLRSANSAQLYIDSQAVAWVGNDGNGAAVRGTVILENLTAGKAYPLEIQYYQGAGANGGLELNWIVPGGNGFVKIPASSLDAPSAGPLSVAIYKFYWQAPLTSLPDFSTQSPVAVGHTDVVNFTPSQWASLGHTSNFAARVTGFLKAPVSGLYAFSLRSLDDAQVYLDGKFAGFNHGRKDVGTVFLKELVAGQAIPLEIQYYQGESANPAEAYGNLLLRWIVPGQGSTGNDFVVVPPSAFQL